MEGPREAQWAPDPFRRHELRYWDGERWTEHVSEGDGAILLDPPLPAPRGRRQARTEADDAAGLAGLVAGGRSRTMTAAPDRLSVERSPVVVPTPVRGTPHPGRHFGPTPLPYGVPTGPAAPSDLFLVTGPRAGTAQGGGPVGPGSRRSAAQPGPAQPAPAQRRGDLFAELPGVAPQRTAGGAPPGRSDAAGEGADGWDWRASRLPEGLSALAVAALIALAAFAGSGGFSSTATEQVDEVSPSASAPATSSTAPAAKKTTKKKKVPGVQLSSAPPGRVVRTSSSTVRATTSPTSRTRSTSPSASKTSPSESSSTDEPSSSSSSSTSGSPSTSSTAGKPSSTTSK